MGTYIVRRILISIPVLFGITVLAFGALSLSERMSADATQRAAILSAWVVGGLLGSLVLERVAHRFRPSTLLMVSGLGCAVAYSAWLATSTRLTSALLLGVAGLFASMVESYYRGRPQDYAEVFGFPVTGPSASTRPTAEHQ